MDTPSRPLLPVGLLLLTGGASRRYGAPKHLEPHPRGGTWGSHLVRVFRETLGPGPERVLGEALPEHPEVAVLEDPREGPAAALVRWAGVERVQALRWWVVPCDQVHWTREFLEDWHRAAAAADPRGDFWVAAETEQGRQVLGGFLGGRLPPALARLRFRRVGELFGALPSLTRPWAWAPFEDVDERPPTPP